MTEADLFDAEQFALYEISYVTIRLLQKINP